MEVKCVSDKTMWTYVIYRHRARGHNRGLRLGVALQKSIVNLTKSYQLFALGYLGYMIVYASKNVTKRQCVIALQQCSSITESSQNIAFSLASTQRMTRAILCIKSCGDILSRSDENETSNYFVRFALVLNQSR